MKGSLRRSLAAVALATTVGVLLPSGARAETSAEVNALFKRGVDSYKEADFRAAAVEFRRAYEASHHDYRVLYNIAQCEYQLTNYVGALAAFERYLADGGAQVKDDKRTEVLGEIAKLKTRVAVLTLKVTPATAQVSLDGEVVKPGESVKLNPGPHKLEATASGFERSLETIEVAGGDARAVTIALKAAATAPPIAPPPVELAPPPSWTAPVVGYVLTGACVGATVAFGLVAKGKESELRDAKATPTADPARLKTLDGQVGTFALVSDIFLGASVVAAGVSTYLTVRTLSSERAAKPRPASVRLTPTFGGALLVGSFQ